MLNHCVINPECDFLLILINFFLLKLKIGSLLKIPVCISNYNLNSPLLSQRFLFYIERTNNFEVAKTVNICIEFISEYVI